MSIEDSSVGISWHMGEGCRAIANGAVRGSLRLIDGAESYGFPVLDIYMGNPLRADIAAAALNGDWAEVLRLTPVETEVAA